MHRFMNTLCATLAMLLVSTAGTAGEPEAERWPLPEEHLAALGPVRVVILVTYLSDDELDQQERQAGLVAAAHATGYVIGAGLASTTTFAGAAVVAAPIAVATGIVAGGLHVIQREQEVRKAHAASPCTRARVDEDGASETVDEAHLAHLVSGLRSVPWLVMQGDPQIIVAEPTDYLARGRVLKSVRKQPESPLLFIELKRGMPHSLSSYIQVVDTRLYGKVLAEKSLSMKYRTERNPMGVTRRWYKSPVYRDVVVRHDSPVDVSVAVRPPAEVLEPARARALASIDAVLAEAEQRYDRVRDAKWFEWRERDRMEILSDGFTIQWGMVEIAEYMDRKWCAGSTYESIMDRATAELARTVVANLTATVPVGEYRIRKAVHVD